MSVCRVNKSKNYTVMSNFHLRDKNLSLKAKGLLSIVLSLPEDWDYSVNGLCQITGEGETSIKSALKELKLSKYLIVTKIFPKDSKSGRIEYVYDFFETPKQECEKQGVENLPLENLGLEILGVENHGQRNTDILNTNIQNKENKLQYNNTPYNPPSKNCDTRIVNDSYHDSYHESSGSLYSHIDIDGVLHDEPDFEQTKIEQPVQAEKKPKRNTRKTKKAITEQEQQEKFAKFWESWPKKIDKQRAFALWVKENPDDELFNKIMTSLEAQKKQESWNKDGGKYIPNPRNWIEGKRWEDQTSVQVGVSSNVSQPIKELFEQSTSFDWFDE